MADSLHATVDTSNFHRVKHVSGEYVCNTYRWVTLLAEFIDKQSECKGFICRRLVHYKKEEIDGGQGK